MGAAAENCLISLARASSAWQTPNCACAVAKCCSSYNSNGRPRDGRHKNCFLRRCGDLLLIQWCEIKFMTKIPRGAPCWSHALTRGYYYGLASGLRSPRRLKHRTDCVHDLHCCRLCRANRYTVPSVPAFHAVAPDQALRRQPLTTPALCLFCSDLACQAYLMPMTCNWGV